MDKENWIEKHKAEKGELPEVPKQLLLGFANYKGKVTPDMRVMIPSGQFWSNLSATQKKQWRETVEWLGEDPEDYLQEMRKMLPKDPPGKPIPNPHLLD